MKKMIFFAILLLIIVIVYIAQTISIINNSEFIYYSPDKKYFLLLIEKEPFMSFGSGNKELRLYTSFYLNLGKCIYGEFPVEIKKWDIKKKEIHILIRQHDISNITYVKQFTEMNNDIGKFRLIYNIDYSYY